MTDQPDISDPAAEPAAKRECPRMTEEQIRDTALGLVQGRIFTAHDCPPEMISSVFMLVALGGLGDIDLDTVGTVYEYLERAGERSVNGYPIFMSMRVAHVDDWAIIVKRAIKTREAMIGPIEGGA